MASLGGESTIPFGPALEKNGGMHLLANIRCVPRTFYTCELSKFYLHYSRTRRRIPIPSIRSSFYKGMTDPLCILQPMGIPLQISLSIPLLRMGCWVGATSESSSHFAPLSGWQLGWHVYLNSRPRIRQDYALNLSILLSAGKENNNDPLSNGEWSGESSNLKSGFLMGLRIVVFGLAIAVSSVSEA